MPSYVKATSDITGNLVLAYGRHVVTGTIVQKVTSGFGDSAQTTIISLLGEGEWDSIEAIYWNGAEVAPSDYHFHAGTPGQTPDVWNVNGNPFPNTAYIIVKLPAGAVTADEEDFSKLKMVCKCVKVQNYDDAGSPDGAPMFSTNPALVAADLLLKRRGLPTSRIDWGSWAAWRDFCDVTIPWTGGETAGVPSYQNSSNIIQTENGGLNKPYGIPANGWNGFISTNQSIPVGVDGYYEIDIDKGYLIFGLSTLNNLSAQTQINFGLYFEPNGNVSLYRNPGDTTNVIGTWVTGDRFRIALDNGVPKVYKNGQAVDISIYTITVPSAPLFGAVGIHTQFAGILRSAFKPMGSTARERKRFEAGLAFPNLTDVSTALNAIMYVSCSDYQDVDGKIVFLTPSMASAVRESTYDFHMGNIVADSFETYRLTASQRPTKITGKFRNADDQYLKEDTVVIKRAALETILGRPNDGGETFLGTMTKGQAECVVNYQMRVASDLDLYCRIKGDGRSFAVVPGDVVTVSHDVTGWSSLQFLVIEAQDDPSTEAPDTRTFILQLFDPNTYSDTDQTPLQSSVRSTLSSELSGPPNVSIVSLTNVQNVLPGGVWINKIRCRVTFNTSYTRGQRAKVYITRPSAAEVLTNIVLAPDVNGFAEFEYTAPETGTYTIRVVSESSLGVVEDIAGVSQTVAVTNLVRTLSIPTSLSASLNINNVVYSWSAPATNAGWITGYEIWDDTGTNRLWAGLSNETSWAETFAGTAPSSVQRRIRTYDAQGNYSAFVQFPVSISLVAPTPTGYTLTFDGNVIVHLWTPGAPSSNSSGYEIATDSAFTNIIWRGADTTYREPVGSTGTFTRYLRAVNYMGRPSAGVSASVVVGAPTVPSAPTVSYARGVNTVSWSAVPNTAYYEIDNGFIIKRITDLSLVENAVTGQNSQTYKVRAINVAGFASTYSATTTVTFPTPAAPASLTLSYTLGKLALVWPASTANDIDYYEILNASDVVVKREYGLSWVTDANWGSSSVTYKVRAVSLVGKASASTSNSITIPTPAAPTSLTITYEKGRLVLTWPASTSADVQYYEVLDVSNAVVRRETGLSWSTVPTYGTTSITYRVRAVSMAGLVSTSVSNAFTMPTPPAPTGYVLFFDGLRILHRWNAIENHTYEVATATNGTGVIWRGQDATFDYYGFSTASRSLTYYLRTLDINGVPSAFVSATINLSAPSAPIIAIDTTRTTPLSVPVKVATTTARDQIQWAVVQYRQSGGSWPISTAEGTANVMRLRGYQDTVPFDWVAGGTAEVRVAHEDLFGIGAWSNIVSHTFARFLDSMFDPNSTLARSVLGAVPMMSGGGVITWNVGNTLTWTGSIIISPVDNTFQPIGRVTIAAATSATVPSGSALIARQTKGSSAAPTLVVADVATYMPPALTDTHIDYWLGFRRTTDGAFVLYNGVVLTSGNSVNGDTFIPYASILNAMIADATITSAKIQNLQADKLVAKSGDLGIILADKLMSRNYVSYSSQSAHDELIAYQNFNNATQLSDGSLQITAINGFADSSRAVFYGTASVKFVHSLDYQIVVSFVNPAGITYGLRCDNSTLSRGLYKVENGVSTAMGTYVPGDNFEVRKVGATITYYKNGVSLGTSTVTDFAPVYVRASSPTANQTIPPLTLNGVLVPTTGEKVRIQNLVGVGLDSNDDFYKIGATSTADSGFSSQQGYSGGIGFSWKMGQTNKDTWVGLSATDASVSNTTILYTAGFGSDGNIYVSYNNGSGTLTTNYTTTDEISIRVEGGVVKLRKNGLQVYQWAQTPPATLYLDTAFGGSGGYVKSLRAFPVSAKPQGIMLDLPNGRGELAGDLVFGGSTVDRVVAAAVGGIAADKRYRGNDFGLFLRHKITSAKVADYRILLDGSNRVDVNLDITFPGKGTDDYANGDSIQFAKIRVLDMFGGQVLPETILQFNGTGRLPTLNHTLNYAHPTKQAVYAIRVWNKFLWSEEIFIQNSSVYLTQPTGMRKADAPKELNAVMDGRFLSLAWREPSLNASTYTSKLWHKWAGRDWYLLFIGSAATSIVSALQGRFPFGTLHEFYVENTSASGVQSNVFPLMVERNSDAPLLKSYWQLSAGDPTNRVRLMVQNAAGNTGRLFIDRYNPDGTVTTFEGVTSPYNDDTTTVGATYYYVAYYELGSVGSSLYSSASNAVVVTIPAGANANDPTQIRITNQTNGQASFAWNLGTATGAVSFDYKVDDGNYVSGWTTVALASGTAAYTLSGLLTQTSYAARVRVADAGTNPSDTVKFSGNGAPPSYYL